MRFIILLMIIFSSINEIHLYSCEKKIRNNKENTKMELKKNKDQLYYFEMSKKEIEKFIKKFIHYRKV